MLVLKDNGGGGLEAGTYLATCVRVVEMGTHTERYQQEDPRQVEKVGLMFEFDKKKTKDGAPYTKTLDVAASLKNKAALRKYLSSWRGRDFTPEELKGFTLDKVLGAPALITINEDGYIKGVAKIMEGQAPEPVQTPIVYLSLDPKEFVKEDFEALPEWLQTKVALSPEWTDCISGAVASTAKSKFELMAEDTTPF